MLSLDSHKTQNWRSKSNSYFKRTLKNKNHLSGQNSKDYFWNEKLMKINYFNNQNIYKSCFHNDSIFWTMRFSELYYKKSLRKKQLCNFDNSVRNVHRSSKIYLYSCRARSVDAFWCITHSYRIKIDGAINFWKLPKVGNISIIIISVTLRKVLLLVLF